MRSLGLVVLFAVLVYAAFAALSDARALASSMASIAPAALAAALALSTVNYVVRFARWTLYLRRLDLKVPPSTSLRIFASGLSMSITPGKLGEAWKSVLLRDACGVPVSRTAGIVIAERLTDLLALLLLVAVAAWRAIDPRLGALTLAMVIALWSAFSFPAWVRPLGRWLRRVGRGALAERLDRFVSSTATLLGPSLLVQGTLVASLGWALEGVALGILAAGLGLEGLSHGDAVIAYAASTIAGAVSMIPGGLGVTEGSMAALLARFVDSAEPTDRIALALLSRFTTLWWGFALGVAAYAVHVRATPSHR